ncbi:hypothetical protein BDF14DRAFT_1735322 [Spinellus fusiger]|nr:hypothetical protein BDF14DRAFT_1735322 [Spinellus fusiger]
MEDDPYNARIERTGCAQENEVLQLCIYDKKDWRLCKEEMQKFRKCYQSSKNNAGSQALSMSENERKKNP